MMQRVSAICCVLVMLLTMTACQPLEMTARDGIASAKGFLDSEAKAHGECNATPTLQVCTLINRGNAAKHTAIDALEQYCTSPEFDAGTAPCTKPTGAAGTIAANQLKAAMANLNQIITDIKAIGK